MQDEILNPATMTTEEKTAEMYRLGREGVLSRREIATRLGMNRNNVCRKLWLAGLTREKTEHERQRRNLPANRRVSRKRERPAVALPAAVAVALPEPPKAVEPSLPKDAFVILPCSPLLPQGAIDILALKPSSCRWVVQSSTGEVGALFCGKEKAHGAYCAEHADMAYVKR